jgi:hypothetical protein
MGKGKGNRKTWLIVALSFAMLIFLLLLVINPLLKNLIASRR